MKKLYIVTVLGFLGLSSTGYGAVIYQNPPYPYYVNPGVVYGGGVYGHGFGYGGGFHRGWGHGGGFHGGWGHGGGGFHGGGWGHHGGHHGAHGGHHGGGPHR